MILELTIYVVEHKVRWQVLVDRLTNLRLQQNACIVFVYKILKNASALCSYIGELHKY